MPDTRHRLRSVFICIYTKIIRLEILNHKGKGFASGSELTQQTIPPSKSLRQEKSIHLLLFLLARIDGVGEVFRQGRESRRRSGGRREYLRFAMQ
jgi:hypothetical protein